MDHTSGIYVSQLKITLGRTKKRRREEEGKRVVNTNFRCVVGCAENQLGRTVVPRTDVRDVGLVLNKDLGGPEIAEFQNTGVLIKEEILRLDVSVTDALGVNVGQGAEKLVDVKLNLQHRHGCLHLVEVSRRPVDGLGDVFEDKVEVHFIFLLRC